MTIHTKLCKCFLQFPEFCFSLITHLLALFFCDCSLVVGHTVHVLERQWIIICDSKPPYAPLPHSCFEILTDTNFQHCPALPPLPANIFPQINDLIQSDTVPFVYPCTIERLFIRTNRKSSILINHLHTALSAKKSYGPKQSIILHRFLSFISGTFVWYVLLFIDFQ